MRSELNLLLRAIAAIAGLLLIANIVPRVYLLGRLQPQVDRLHRMQQQLEQMHSATVDEETGLRAYLATGSTVFLEPYDAGVPKVSRLSRQLALEVTGDALSRDLANVRLAQRRWFDGWARRAADPAQAAAVGAASAGPVRVAPLTAFLTSGKNLFDAYRAAHDAFAADVEQSLRNAAAVQNAWVLGSGILQALIAAVAVVVTLAVSRRLRRLIAAPVASLARTVALIRSGDLSARVPVEAAPSELVALSLDVDDMAAELQRQADLARLREQEARLNASRLQVVLDAARAIAGSLSLRYILEAVTAAAQNVGTDRTRVWLVDEDGCGVTLSFDTAADRKSPQPTVHAGISTGIVGRALQHARTVGPEQHAHGGLDVVAVPMMIGARAVGVLECFRSPTRDDGDVIDILEALAGHAAASLESARLHERTKEVAVTDGLTGLPNRRAFDADLETEVRRATRHGRPLSLIYVDLDHFKTLNDDHGHQYGDVALQQAAGALRHNLRDGDRVYRVGGEEMVVLAAETTADDAAAIAERLRHAIETCAAPGAPQLSASFGVAELPGNAKDGSSLVRAADRALYAAKTSGRNRVVVSGADQRSAAVTRR